MFGYDESVSNEGGGGFDYAGTSGGPYWAAEKPRGREKVNVAKVAAGVKSAHTIPSVTV